MSSSGFGRTDPGLKRKKNDDYFLVDDSLGLYVVCDGVGGHACGNEASELCARTIHEHIQAKSDLVRAYEAKLPQVTRSHLIDLLRKAVEAANERVHALGSSSPEKRGTSTTVDALLVTRDYAFLAHIGDSRIYLLRAGKAHQLTEDHKISRELVKEGVLSEDQAEVSPYAHVLSRAVGPQKAVRSDLLQLELVPGDRFLLCSDGLADYLKGHDLVSDFGSRPIASVPEQLVAYAKEQGGHDNITAIAVSFEGRPSAPAAALDALRKSEILGKVPLFRYLEFAELVKVLSFVHLETFQAGTLLMEEGKPAEDLYILVSGTAEVLKDGQAIAQRAKGDVIGEMGLIDQAPRSASIRSKEPLTALRLARKDLVTLLRQESQIAVKFLWALNQELTQRLRSTTADLASARSTSELPF
jgi:serine/threonine protein phosphatase PrpC